MQNNDYTDVDEVEDYLRRANPAYKRRPQAQFRKVVERAVQTVQREGGPTKPELRLQVNVSAPAAVYHLLSTTLREVMQIYFSRNTGSLATFVGVGHSAPTWGSLTAKAKMTFEWSDCQVPQGPHLTQL